MPRLGLKSPEENRPGDRLHIRSQDYRLIGYAESTRYILFEMESRRIIYSRNVVFDKGDCKVRSPKDVIEIAEDGDNLSPEQRQTPITVQIDQSDEVGEIDDLPDPEEERDDLEFFSV